MRRTLDVRRLFVVVVVDAESAAATAATAASATAGSTPLDLGASQLVASDVFAFGKLPADEDGRRPVLLQVGRQFQLPILVGKGGSGDFGKTGA